MATTISTQIAIADDSCKQVQQNLGGKRQSGLIDLQVDPIRGTAESTANGTADGGNQQQRPNPHAEACTLAGSFAGESVVSAGSMSMNSSVFLLFIQFPVMLLVAPSVRE